MFFLTILGAILLIVLLIKLLFLLWRLLYPYVLTRPKDLHQLSGNCRWALVTGCTQGIGRAYAHELALKDFSLVLVSRSAQKLAAMEKEFQQQFAKVEILCVPFDFSEPSVDAYRNQLLAKIQHLDIGILVNNVGAGNVYPQRFHDAEGGFEKMAEIMTVNMFPVTLLTADLLKQMVKRERGVIVNISSIAALNPFYFMAIYSATKKYVNWLSAALRKEYTPQKGIIIQTICPGAVITQMSRAFTEGMKPSFFMPSPEQFARSAIRTIGHAKETAGCLAHQIQFEFYDMAPDFYMKKRMHVVRDEYVKKRRTLSNI